MRKLTRITKDALSILSEIEIKYKTKIPKDQRIKITNSTEINDLLHIVYDQDEVEYKEVFYVVILNHANEVLGVKKISEGGLSGTVVDPKMIFQIALKGNAGGIILSHNHPSGNLKPSEADRSITKKLVEGGKLLQLPILDHIIYTPFGYMSFADEGLI